VTVHFSADIKALAVQAIFILGVLLLQRGRYLGTLTASVNAILQRKAYSHLHSELAGRWILEKWDELSWTGFIFFRVQYLGRL
jgi:hypothetical protein